MAIYADSASIKAARCVAHFLTSKTKKKMTDSGMNADIPFLIIEVPVRQVTPPLYVLYILLYSVGRQREKQ